MHRRDRADAPDEDSNARVASREAGRFRARRHSFRPRALSLRALAPRSTTTPLRWVYPPRARIASKMTSILGNSRRRQFGAHRDAVVKHLERARVQRVRHRHVPDPKRDQRRVKFTLARGRHPSRRGHRQTSTKPLAKEDDGKRARLGPRDPSSHGRRDRSRGPVRAPHADATAEFALDRSLELLEPAAVRSRRTKADDDVARVRAHRRERLSGGYLARRERVRRRHVGDGDGEKSDEDDARERESRRRRRRRHGVDE